jgi:1-deoxyxylulose-5-phosphate synthase
VKYGDIPEVGNHLSRFVLGSMVFSPERLDNTYALLDGFVAAGGNFVDTAYVYARGQSEVAFGMWLKARGARDQVTILTKGGFGAYPDGSVKVSPELIAEHLATSLDRLGVETIDLYVLHRDDPKVPVEEIVDAMNEHVAAGRIRAWGGSNWSHRRIAEANTYADEARLHGIVASSPNLALAVPLEPMWSDNVTIAGDAEALRWYRQTRLPILAWSSQARGFFSGRFSPEVCPDPDVRRVYYSPENWERLRRAQALATERGVSAINVALAWVLHQPLNVFPLVGPATPAELADTLRALEISLSPAEAAWLNLEQEGRT